MTVTPLFDVKHEVLTLFRLNAEQMLPMEHLLQSAKFINQSRGAYGLKLVIDSLVDGFMMYCPFALHTVAESGQHIDAAAALES